MTARPIAPIPPLAVPLPARDFDYLPTPVQTPLDLVNDISDGFRRSVPVEEFMKSRRMRLPLEFRRKWTDLHHPDAQENLTLARRREN